MMNEEKVIVCDKCKREFLLRSVQIKETSVEIAGEELLLDYFTCPYCNAVYKVLFVEEAKYRELVDDLMATQKRINRQQGKSNPGLLRKLQGVAAIKQNRIRKYVNEIARKFPGSFEVLATENKQQPEQIVYLP